MTEKKYLLFSLDEDESKKLGEVISNPTSKKILSLLSETKEKGISESDIAKMLNLPANTVNYNVKRLLEAGLIEKTKNFFWSSKGKKIATYRVANKLIVISPNKTSASNVYNKLKNILPVALISGVLTMIIGIYFNVKESALKVSDSAYAAAESASLQATAKLPDIITQPPTATGFISSIPEPWMWFALGSLTTLIVHSVWNWRRI